MEMVFLVKTNQHNQKGLLTKYEGTSSELLDSGQDSCGVNHSLPANLGSPASLQDSLHHHFHHSQHQKCT